MANSFDFQIRPLRRVEYDKLGVFEGERIEFPDFELRVADVLPSAK